MKKINGTGKSMKATPKQEQRKKPAKVVMVRVQMDIMVSVGQDDDRSFEEFRDDAVEQTKDFLKDQDGPVAAKNATVMSTSGYYLVDGRVCLPDDYDPKTRNFKPGAHPPLWAMGPDEQKIVQRIEREKNRPALARQPQNLRTSTETDEYHELLRKDPEAAKEHRKNETKRVLDDLRENTDWGKRRTELEEVEDVEDIDDFEDEEDVEDIEDEWDEDDVFDEEAADEVVNSSSSSVLARLRAKKARK
ncbi:hypothetical protein [Streptomyces levis]|uniref:hypothetical protein n=1 Tax=Streptomyces levis TaxID=285566 RepID=UPI0031DD4DDD